jgi:peptidoglycan/LPS O-acetylase OafA/YrhL
MNKHLHTLDFLRGIAALGVVALHFTLTSFFVKESNIITDVFKYGKYGVQIFFVISGFIIPYSMMKSEYKLSDYFNYLKRRFVRICIPSYGAIILTFILYYAVILILGRPINNMNWPGINFTALFGNLTYTVPYLETSWYNPVYWTLTIEFQFYILIGLLLPLFMKKNNLLTLFSLIIVLIAGAIFSVDSFLNYSCFFVFGICLFLKRSDLLPNYHNVFLFTVSVGFCFYLHGYIALLFSIIAFLIILSEVKINYWLTKFLGKISFSIYITHCVVEIVSEVFINRFIDLELNTLNRVILLIAYLSFTIAFAAIFYKYIEKPFALYSKKIKRKKLLN